MTDSTANLVLGIDTTQAIKGSTDLDKLAVSGERLEQQFTKTGKATDGWQQNMRGVDAAMKSSAERAIEYSQATQRIIDRYEPLGTKMRSLQADLALLQREMGNSSADAAIKSFQGLEAEIERTAKLMQTAGVAGFEDSAKAAERGAFATAGAKRELMVLGHEAMQGNFSKMPGSFIVLAERMDLTTMLMSPMTLGIIGIGAAAIGAAVAIAQGAAEMGSYSKSLILTGNSAGATSLQLQAMAVSIGASADSTIGKAAEAIAAFSSSGKFAADQMSQYSAVAIRLEKELGTSIDDTIKQFIELGKGPVDASAKLNETTHYLTAAIFEQINALTNMGDKAAAAALAQSTWADAMNSRVPRLTENLGYLEQGWRGVTGAAKGAWDAMAGIGRSEDPAARVARQIAEIEQHAAPGRGIFSGLSDVDKARLVNLKEQQMVINAVASQEKLLAEAKKKTNDQTEAAIAFSKIADGYQSNALKTNKLITEATVAGIAAGKSQIEIDKTISDIRLANADKVKKAPKDRSDPYASEREAAKEWAKYFSDFEKMSEDAEAKTLSLSKAQEELVKYLSSGAYKTNTEDMRQLVLQKAYATIATEQFNAANKAGEKDHNAYIQTLVKSADAIDKQVIKMQDENAAADMATKLHISLAQAVDLAAVARIKENLAIQMNFGDDKAVSAIQHEIDARKRLSDLIGIADARKSDGALAYLNSIGTTSVTIGKTMENSFKGMENSLVNFVKTGKLDFGSLADSIISDMVRISIRQSITVPLAGQASSFFGSMFSPSVTAGSNASGYQGTMNNTSAYVASANGNVFSSPSLSAFSGGVYDTPKTFAFAQGAGIFAEAGPEAIMPLTRGSNGKLGVQSSGGGGGNSMVVNIVESPGNGGKQSRTTNNGVDTLTVMVEQIKASIAGDINKGSGAVPSALSRTYGLNRSVGSY